MQSPKHDATNQVPPLIDNNLYTSDAVLMAGVQRLQAGWHANALERYGAELGRPEIWALAETAHRHPPELHCFDSLGNRIDVVAFHPAWHTLLGMLRRENLHASPWSEPRAGSNVARAAGYFLHAQVEAGSLCPTTMTFASIPVLQKEPALFAALQAKLYSREHDQRDLPLGQKTSMLVGMGMTEKQGGSDVRSNTTLATPLAGGSGRGADYLLTGHKWFFSAPMCDAHMVLARTECGISCFFVPRWRPDGSKNSLVIQQLKDKLGNRSNASSEVNFENAFGIMVGDEGRGITTIIEMANHTRLDCVIGSAGLMRQALVQALHYARHRSAFGARLIEQPLMQNVLADLALESEAATLLMLQLASAFDAPNDPLQRAWQRIVTPAAKFWICKRALAYAGECMEVWGGNGYVETGPMARFYREAPVNSIWEGSGNVMCLDVLRAIERESEGLALLLQQLSSVANGHAEIGLMLTDVKKLLSMPLDQQQRNARRLLQTLILTIQATLMVQHAPSPIADAFIKSRCDATVGFVYGTLSVEVSEEVQKHILQRAASY